MQPANTSCRSRVNRSEGNRMFFGALGGPQTSFIIIVVKLLLLFRVVDSGLVTKAVTEQDWQFIKSASYVLSVLIGLWWNNFFEVPLACDLILWKLRLLAREQQETWELQSARQLLCLLGTHCDRSHGFTHKSVLAGQEALLTALCVYCMCV